MLQLENEDHTDIVRDVQCPHLLETNDLHIMNMNESFGFGFLACHLFVDITSVPEELKSGP